MRIPGPELARAITNAQELAKLKKATEQIDGIFLKQLLEQMQHGSSMFGEGPQSGTYQDFFNQAMVDSMSKRGGLGLGELMYKHLSPRIAARILPDSTVETQPKS